MFLLGKHSIFSFSHRRPNSISCCSKVHWVCGLRLSFSTSDLEHFCKQRLGQTWVWKQMCYCARNNLLRQKDSLGTEVSHFVLSRSILFGVLLGDGNGAWSILYTMYEGSLDKLFKEVPPPAPAAAAAVTIFTPGWGGGHPTQQQHGEGESPQSRRKKKSPKKK